MRSYVFHGLPFLICTATPLRLYACIFLADGRNDFSVNLAIAAMLKALRERNFVPISLLSDGEGAITLCTDIMRSPGERINPAGQGQHVPTVEAGI